jgi:penicillin-binding protein 2
MKTGPGQQKPQGERIISQEQRINTYKSAYIIILCLMALVLLVLCYRFYQLQIVKGEFYTEKSEKNFIQNRRVPAIRGIIFDRKRRPLVDNRASFNLYLTPAFSKKPLQTLRLVDRIIGLNMEDLRRAEDLVLKAKGLKRFQQILLSEDLDSEKLALFEFHRMELDGIEAIPVPHRNYKYGASASHLLGYMGEIDQDTLDKWTGVGRSYRQGDYIGKKGVEMAFEEDLKGVDGSEQVLVDAKGRRVEEKDFKGIFSTDSRKPASPGRNLILAMDLDVQTAAEAAFDGQEGGVVALDARSGQILAMVSRPAFDPNVLTGKISKDSWWKLLTDPLKPLVNKVTQDHNHPGSTFKVVPALAALDTGAIVPSTHQACGGSFKLGTRPFRCWKEGGHGTIDLHRAIVQSCDVFFYRLGDRLGIEKQAAYARMLGFGEKSGIEIRDEVPGVIPDVDFYNQPKFGGYQKGYSINTSIGQGDVNVTLLQLALAYAAIVNGGTILKPQTVLSIEAPDGSEHKKIEPETRSTLAVKTEHLEVIKNGLGGVVNEPGGTAYTKRIPELRDIEVGGKTGTAQVVAVGAKRLKAEDMEFMQRDHAWFVAFAPVDKPEVVVAVINKHGGHGGSAAAPIAMKVLKSYFEKVNGVDLSRAKVAKGTAARDQSDLEDSVYLPGQMDDTMLIMEQQQQQ